MCLKEDLLAQTTTRRDNIKNKVNNIRNRDLKQTKTKY